MCCACVYVFENVIICQWPVGNKAYTNNYNAKENILRDSQNAMWIKKGDMKQVGSILKDGLRFRDERGGRCKKEKEHKGEEVHGTIIRT